MNLKVLRNSIMTVVICGCFGANASLADKPSWAGEGNGKGQGHGKHAEHHEKGDDRHEVRQGEYFADRHRTVVRDYYHGQYSRGHCPPGLAKKNNGCMPPGQAKKWAVGAPLPRDIVYYEVPQPLVVKIGPPPSGYRYVRVASDILLIALGSRMVIDAVQDLGRI